MQFFFSFFLLQIFAVSNIAYAQEEISGKVTDSKTKDPVVGVNILVKGTTTGASTDIDGKYSITVPSAKDTLVVTYIGYKTKEVAVNGRSTVNISLESKVIEGEEAVVVAFGKKQKKDIVGAVTSINNDDLQAATGGNLTTALAGQAAGIISFQRSGEPGEDNADFFIRGVTTFGYKKNPLILVDDIEVDPTQLARLEPDNIANFSILKDATATSLYGSRAANGVILIETKHGHQGKAVISVRLENALSQPTREIELADPITYMRLRNEAALTRDPLAVRPYTRRKIDNTISGQNPYVYPTTNWKEMLFKDNTMNQRFNLSVRGGGDVARYYVAGSFDQDNGLLKNDKRNNFDNNISLKNYSLLSNIDVDLTNTTTISVKLNGNFDDYQGPLAGGADVWNAVMRTDPVSFPPFYPKNEEFSYFDHPLFGNTSRAGGLKINPYADMVKGFKEYDRSVMSAQLRLNQNLESMLQGLAFSGVINTRRNSYLEVKRSYNPYWFESTSYNRLDDTYELNLLNEDEGTNYLNYIPGDKTVISSTYAEARVTYGQTFTEKHNVGGLLVGTIWSRTQGGAPDLQSSLPRRNVNFAGRATYDYDKRYYAQFNFGYNGSERFDKNHRFGFFPSVGTAWNISEEKFWKPFSKTINNFRLRATYGLSGNDAIGRLQDRFFYLSKININDPAKGATFGKNNNYSRGGISLLRYSNPKITWEKAKKSNLGIELGLFNQIDITADIYKEVRTQILMDRVATPASLGLSSVPQANIGEASSRGIDLSFTHSKFFDNGWWIRSRANFTYATNEYRTFEEFDYDNEPWKSHIGNPVSQRYGYIAERLFIDEQDVANSPKQNFGEYGAGDLKYRDVNGDEQITTLDQVPIGNPITPEMVYGFGFSTGYKNFDISAFFQGLANESFWINPVTTTPFKGDQQLLKAYAEDHWSEDNRDSYALWPRFSNTAIGNENNSKSSTWLMRDGSFLRLKRVELAYNLPQNILKNFSMRNLRIYLTGSNLHVWSNFDLWDIEMAGEGLGYPIQRVYTLGIQASF